VRDREERDDERPTELRLILALEEPADREDGADLDFMEGFREERREE